MPPLLKQTNNNKKKKHMLEPVSEDRWKYTPKFF